MIKVDSGDEMSVKEIYVEIRRLRRLLQDMTDDLETAIQYMPEHLYYYDNVQVNSDELLKTLRQGWALADELVSAILCLQGGEL